MGNDPPSQVDIICVELAYLRQKHDDASRETTAYERYALLITGLVFSWCATHNEADFLTILWWFPNAACALLGLRSFANHLLAKAIRGNIKKLHDKLHLADDLSWEHIAQSAYLRATTFYCFWLTLVPGTLAVAVFFTFYSGR